MLWRYPIKDTIYQSCKQIMLPEGVLISHDFDKAVQYVKSAIYQQRCYKGVIPMLNTNVNLVMNTFADPLPIVRQSWTEYTTNPRRGTFIFSVVPLVYSLSISSVITWFLTIFVITNYTIRPSVLLKFTSIISSLYMLITVVKSIVILHGQQRRGFLHGYALLDQINSSVYLNVIDMIVTFLLQVSQAQVLIRLFSRQSDKRTVFLVGLLSSIASQTLWSVMKFHKFNKNAEMEKILPALIYLFRIAMSISYAAIFTAFILTKSKTLMLHREMWAISLLTLVFIYAPVAFFIADVSNTWVYELSEVFSVVTYVVCVVIPWEWCNQYNVIRKQQEKEGVLGRKFYEDELYELDKFQLFVEEEDSDVNDEDGSPSLHSSTNNQSGPSNGSDGTGDTLPKPESRLKNLANGLTSVKDMFVTITDNIIATGLAIPRSVSIGSNGNNTVPTTHFDIHTPRHRSRSTGIRIPQPETNRNKNVFVYSTRDVVINMDDNQTENDV
ncbi:PalH/RIM21 family protein [Clavispora lusitaniae]|uniref:PalH/RIM21 family protein n=1 Tax=Clavispora lusitaniae TaxID=36911 RepID=UPI00202C1154|nr:PalH/RIM21 family protein [Clavispora lusitaniae]